MAEELRIPYAIVGITDMKNPIFLHRFGHDHDQNACGKESFPIGCVTKCITAMAASVVSMDFDMPLCELGMDIRYPDSYMDRNLTAKDLLSHRSGLRPNSLWLYITRHASILEKLDQVHDLAHDPFRYQYIYTNLAFALMEYYLKKITGKLYSELIQEEIFVPLCMKDTFLSLRDAAERTQVSIPLYVEHESCWIRHKMTNLYSINASSGVVSTAEDMMKLLHFILENKKKFAHLWRSNMITSRINVYKELDQERYGMGFFIQKYREHEIIYHHGYNIGCTTYFGFLPKENLGFFIMANVDKSTFPQTIIYDLLDAIDGVYENHFKRWLMLERRVSRTTKERLEQTIKLSKNRFSTFHRYMFNGFGLYGYLDAQDLILSINEEKLPLWRLDENVYAAFIETVNDYLIITCSDTTLHIRGTSDFDAINLKLSRNIIG